MVWHIINEVRQMRRKYYEQSGKRGEIICLDANAEARLAAHLVFELSCDECCLVSRTNNNPEADIMEVLENGIRHLGITLYGMKLKFDCPSFSIEGTGQRYFDFSMGNAI